MNAVAPGLVETEMAAALPDAQRTATPTLVPLGRVASAEDVAEAVAFLCSPAAGYVTGQVLARERRTLHVSAREARSQGGWTWQRAWSSG